MHVFSRSASGAFTLVEVMVSSAVIVLLLAILLSVTNHTSQIWRQTTGRTEQFRQAREGFDAMARRISHATLNTYWDYDDPDAPTRYVRQSELRFLCGPMQKITAAPPTGREWPTHGVFFQAPLGSAEPGQTTLAGLNSLLNTWGYFIEYGSDKPFRPPILDGSMVKERYRFRLCELIQPADALSIYNYTSGKDASGKPKNLSYTGTKWFSDALGLPDNVRPVRSLSENVIALVFNCSLSARDIELQKAAGKSEILAPGHVYDSTKTDSDPMLNQKNQLPPVVDVTLVAVDESSAKRMELGNFISQLNVGSLFDEPAAYNDHLFQLEKALKEANLSYRTFNATVQIKGAKWSREQQN